MDQCIICGKEHEELTECYLKGKKYKGVCSTCNNKIYNLGNVEISVWVQRMIEIDRFTDEGIELLESVMETYNNRTVAISDSSKWSRIFSLIMSVVGIITIIIGLALGYSICELLDTNKIVVLIGGLIGTVIAVFEIALGKVIAEIGINIGAIRNSLEIK